MSWGFAESLVFAAVMTMRDLSREKERKLIKTQKFYQKYYEEIADETSHAFNLVSSICTKACSVYFPKEIVDGARYLPLYCFGLVINRQGRVTAEQNKVLGFYFKSLELPFTQSQYVSAMSHGRDIADYNKLMNLSSHGEIGRYWLNIFRAFHKTGSQREFQELVDSITGTIMKFSILGNPNSNISLDICDNFIREANHQIQNCMSIPVTEIDWLGVVPVEDRISSMLETYKYLLSHTDITETVDEDMLMELFDVLFLHCIFDIVVLTKKPNSVKLQMVNESLKFIGVTPVISPQQYIKDIATQDSAGAIYHQMFAVHPECGNFWKILLTMFNLSNRGDALTPFLNDLMSVLIQVEQFLVEKYRFLGTEQIVSKYSTNLIEGILAEIQS